MDNRDISWMPEDGLVIHIHNYKVINMTGAQLIKFIETHNLEKSIVVGKIDTTMLDINNESQTGIVLEMESGPNWLTS